MYPSRCLRRPTVSVAVFDEALEHKVALMVRSLASQTWGSRLGLAANQIGLTERMAIVLGRLVINPTWQPSKAPPDISIEGCYSLGMEKMFRVKRAPYGWAKWQDIHGEWHEEKLRGMKAVVFQHEIDHLDGRTCVEGGEPVEVPDNVKRLINSHQSSQEESSAIQ